MMVDAAILAPSSVPLRPLAIRKIGWPDLVGALREGFADFSAKPSHMMFLCLIYPIGGVLISIMATNGNLLPLLFPLTAGFALLGPFAAIGLYELSRRREQGLNVSWTNVFELRRSPSLRAIFEIGLLLAVLFVAWLAAAQVIYNMTLGPGIPASASVFFHDLLTTRGGWTLIVVGNAVGCLFACVSLMVGVASFPLLVDRNVGFLVALTTSVRCVVANPLTLALWGVIVAGALIIGTLPVFVGLAVVLPILGHATWHLYRKLVDA